MKIRAVLPCRGRCLDYPRKCSSTSSTILLRKVWDDIRGTGLRKVAVQCRQHTAGIVDKTALMRARSLDGLVIRIRIWRCACCVKRGSYDYDCSAKTTLHLIPSEIDGSKIVNKTYRLYRNAAAVIHTTINQTCTYIVYIVIDNVPCWSDIGKTNSTGVHSTPTKHAPVPRQNFHPLHSTHYFHWKLLKSVAGSNLVNKNVSQLYFKKRETI